MEEGGDEFDAEGSAANRPPAKSQTDDPDLVAFLTVTTAIFAALWFGIALIAGVL